MLINVEGEWVERMRRVLGRPEECMILDTADGSVKFMGVHFRELKYIKLARVPGGDALYADNASRLTHLESYANLNVWHANGEGTRVYDLKHEVKGSLLVAGSKPNHPGYFDQLVFVGSLPGVALSMCVETGPSDGIWEPRV